MSLLIKLISILSVIPFCIAFVLGVMCRPIYQGFMSGYIFVNLHIALKNQDSINEAFSKKRGNVVDKNESLV